VIDVALRLALRFQCNPEHFMSMDIPLLLAYAKRVGRLTKESRARS
jgi:hypothetical protein